MSKDFFQSLKNNTPPSNYSDNLKSLWWDKKDDWDQAHSIAQTIATNAGSAIHAYLHRKEGVLWNADYWYRKAGKDRPDIPLDKEWDMLLDEMLKLQG